jgi:hypothetical protein
MLWKPFLNGNQRWYISHVITYIRGLKTLAPHAFDLDLTSQDIQAIHDADRLYSAKAHSPATNYYEVDANDMLVGRVSIKTFRTRSATSGCSSALQLSSLPGG